MECDNCGTSENVQKMAEPMAWGGEEFLCRSCIAEIDPNAEELKLYVDEQERRHG